MPALAAALLPQNWTSVGFGKCVKSTGGNNGALYGAVAGGAAVVALAVGFVVYNNRKKAKQSDAPYGYEGIN